MIHPDYMRGLVAPYPIADGPTKPWITTDDAIITCVVCDGENCDLERTSLVDGRGGRKVVTVGLHSRCFIKVLP